MAARAEYELHLYVAGMTPRSRAAIENLTRICLEHLDGRYELDIVDLYQQPERARQHDVVAAPTLVRTRPAPLRRLVGELSDEARVLEGLGLRRKRLA